MVHVHAGVPLGGRRREGDADAPRRPSARPGRRRWRSEHNSSSISAERARRSQPVATADRARPRPDDGRAERHAERGRLRPAAHHCGQPAERALAATSWRFTPSRRDACCPGRSTTTRSRPTPATTCRSANASCVASRLQFGNIRPAGGDPENVPFAKKYFLGGATSIRGWGRYEVSPLSGRACRSAATA